MKKFRLKIPINGIKPAVIGKEMEKIAKKYNNALTPEILVNEAKNSRSPIHGCFTWNNKKAAHKCRLLEARYLLRNVIVEYEDEDELKTVRAFISVGNTEYKPIKSIMSNEDLYNQMLEDAYKDLKEMKDKYSMLKELKFIWKQLKI